MSEHEQEPREVKVKVTDKRGDASEPPADETSAAPEADGQEQAAEVDPVAEAEALAAQRLDDLQRLKAEFDNFRKRTIREQTAMVERATDALIERLLPVLDNFELALIAADRTNDYASLVKGVEMVFGELHELLGKEGLKRIDALHQPFDPSKHEAVMRVGDGDEMVVLEEMRPGYLLGDRVVRPAMVKVGPPKERDDG